MAEASYAIEGVDLHKAFVKKRSLWEIFLHPLRRGERIDALRGVDLAVREGEILALLGPNGAGKTTLLKILSCLVLPDRGRAVVGGFETRNENAVKKRIGLVHSDERSFYWRLTARQNLRFFAVLYDVPPARAESRIDELLTRVDMQEAADRPFGDYSSGMKQKIAIARALLHDPPILLMDEPTKSLDPHSALELRGFVLEQLKARDGKTILLASHNLREVESMADRVAILVRGRVRQVGTIPEVRRWGVEERQFRLEIEGTLPEGPFRVDSDRTSEGRRRLLISVAKDTVLDDVLRALLGAGVTVHACDRVEPDLEAAFSRILAAEEEEEDRE